MHIFTLFEKFTKFKEFDNIIEDIYEQVKNLYLNEDKKSDESKLNIKKKFEGKELEFNITIEYGIEEEEVGINAMCYGGENGAPVGIWLTNVPKNEKSKNLKEIYRILTHELSHAFETIKSGVKRGYKNISTWDMIHPKNNYYRKLKGSFYLLEDNELYAEGISLVKKFKKYMDPKKSFDENFKSICDKDDKFEVIKLASIDMSEFIKRIDDAYLRLKNGDLKRGGEEEDRWHDTYESCEHIVNNYVRYRNDEFGTKDIEGFRNEMKKFKTKFGIMSKAKQIAKIKMNKVYKYIKKLKTDCYKIYTEK